MHSIQLIERRSEALTVLGALTGTGDHFIQETYQTPSRKCKSGPQGRLYCGGRLDQSVHNEKNCTTLPDGSQNITSGISRSQLTPSEHKQRASWLFMKARGLSPGGWHRLYEGNMDTPMMGEPADGPFPPCSVYSH